jgi:hypothetical protein
MLPAGSLMGVSHRGVCREAGGMRYVASLYPFAKGALGSKRGAGEAPAGSLRVSLRSLCNIPQEWGAGG